MLQKTLVIILTFSTLVGMVYGATNHFAKSEDVKLLALRLDQKIEGDQIDIFQKMVWDIEDRYRDKNTGLVNINKMPPAEKERYRKLQQTIKRLEKSLKAKGEEE